MRSAKFVVLAGVAALALIVGALALRPKRATPVESAVPEPLPVDEPTPQPLPPIPALPVGLAAGPPHAREPVATAAAAAAPARPAPVGAPGAPATTETALMAQLRNLGGSNPELSLRLARDASRQFGDSADAAERSWFVVRSLMDLARLDEARAEARTLLDRYPASSWAQDVHRHMFVNPPGHPLERGYGKQLELE